MWTSNVFAPRLALLVALGSCMSASGVRAQDDPFTGTWTLNPERSTSAGGRPTFRQVLTFTVAGDLEEYRSEVVNAQGTTQITIYRARYDGRTYPSTVSSSERPGESPGDGVVLRKIDERTRERIVMRDGRVVRIMRRSLSADGRTLTSVLSDVDAEGQEAVSSTLVYEKG